MLDQSRNGPGSTVVAPYSPRARRRATVSFPVLASDLARVRPDDFSIRSAPGLLGGAAARG